MTREEAIEDIKHAVNWAKENDERWCDGVEIGSLELAIEALEQPEQKKGKWIKNEDGTWSCSLCHSWISYDQHYYARYCLYCGAKMEGF